MGTVTRIPMRERALAAVLEVFPFLLRLERRAGFQTMLLGDVDHRFIPAPHPRCLDWGHWDDPGCGRGHRVSVNVCRRSGSWAPCDDPADRADLRVTAVAGEPCDEVFGFREAFAAWDAAHAGAPRQPTLF
jgi:hypothetical protein